MSTRVGWATLQVIPSAKDFGKNLSKDVDPQMGAAGRKTGGAFGGALLAGAGRFAGPLAAVFAGAQVGSFLKDAITQASDLGEAANKLKTVFGSATDQVMAFAGKGAQQLGQSNLAIQNAAATFGVYGKAAGLAGKENAAFSTQLVQLSTDLASFYNTDPSQAMEAIAAGLRGESEPLRQYGVLLDDATLRNEALRLGLIKTTKQALTPQQRVLAAQAAIMKQTKVAQGDFAKTSGGLANQQRILTAQWEDAKAKLGQAFLPAVTSVVRALNSGLGPAVKAVMGGLDKAGPTFSKAGDAAKLFFGSFTGQGADVDLGKWTNPIIDAGAAFRTAFDGAKTYAASLMPTLKGIGAVFADLGQFAAKFFREQLLPMWQWMATTAMPLVGQLGDLLKTGFEAALPVLRVLGTVLKAVFGFLGPVLIATVKPIFKGIVGIISGAIQTIKGVFQIIKGIFTLDWPLIWTGVKNVFGGAWKIILSTLKGVAGGIWALIKGLFGDIVSWIGSKLAQAGRAVASWAASVGRWFASMGSKIRSTVSGFASAVVSFFGSMMSRARSAVTSGISRLISAFTGMKNRVIDTVKGLASRFVSIGSDVISGFIRGIQNSAGRIIGAVRSAITDKLPAFVKDALGIHSPSRVFMALGRFVSTGMAYGIRQKAGEVTKAVSALTKIPDATTVNVGAVSARALSPAMEAAGPTSYHLHDSQATIAQLRALQERQAITARIGRAR
ncbi:hypothetical protein [Micromonospora sp. WMMD980]|uniref:phage tail protein n=1 Tax=Micromonospora sp. WMMD980 TaxID=3016088 RepID=UPI002417A105|nr:hypothetical protein [Micromonospora sp. WMMD980]MDG4801724.1 hypothetical protein [Micromonospora sp. WMMD980]